jgi:hypothetical protein
MINAVDQFAKGAKAIRHRVALLEAEVSSLRKVCKTHRIYWLKRLQMRKHPRKGNRMVVMREVPVQSRGAVALAVKLGIMRELAQRLQNHRLHLFPM